MLIGVKKRFIFVANSKTASTSIEKALVPHAEIQRGGPSTRKHIFLRAALREYDFVFGRKKYAPNTFFKFGVMRDPVDWIQSWYRYRSGNKVSKPLDEGTTFETFWRQRAEQSEKSGKKRLQRNFFTRVNGTLIADYIIPYDALSEHFEVIAKALDVEATLPRQNVSKVQNLEESPSQELLDEIRAYYAEDYALYEQIAEINARGLERLAATRPQSAEEPALTE